MEEAGIADELDGIELGDQRLNRRSRRILTALAANCEASINGSMNGWADTQAAYRFFRNELVTPEQIPAPHVEATQRRVSEQKTVLVLQDTTSFNFSAHPARDQQCLCEPTQRGFYQHVNLAVTPDRLPLGVLSAECFDRAAESFERTSLKSRRTVEDRLPRGTNATRNQVAATQLPGVLQHHRLENPVPGRSESRLSPSLLHQPLRGSRMETGLANRDKTTAANHTAHTDRFCPTARSTGWLQQPLSGTSSRTPTTLDRRPPNARLRHRLADLRTRNQYKMCVNDRESPGQIHETALAGFDQSNLLIEWLVLNCRMTPSTTSLQTNSFGNGE